MAQRPNINLSALDISSAEREFLGQLLAMVTALEVEPEVEESNELEALLFIESFGSGRRGL